MDVPGCDCNGSACLCLIQLEMLQNKRGQCSLLLTLRRRMATAEFTSALVHDQDVRRSPRPRRFAGQRVRIRKGLVSIRWTPDKVVFR